MRFANLDSRLALTASMVRKGSRMADIGTDHAYLPIWLIQQAICPGAVATDVHRGPVSRAAEAVAAAGLNDRIAVRLGDGLLPVHPDEVEDIVVAGMGGETIASILSGVAWITDDRYRLVLQPMSKIEWLREYLLSSGFALTEEHVAKDGRHLYIVLGARYQPEMAAMQAAEPAIGYRGVLSWEEGREYLQKQRRRLEHVVAALREAGNAEEADRLSDIAVQL